MAIGGELDVDRGDVLEGLGSRGVDDVHEEAGALDVTKELLAKAGAVARAFDEAGDIGDHELAVIQSCDAEVWRQRGEGIVGDLGTRARESREEGRLSGVRQAREADVRE